MLTPATPELLHIVGFLTGATLYAMLLAMVVRVQAAGDRLTIVTALLGLAWNLGQLTTSGLRGLSWPVAEHWTLAGSYTALGFLAAVVVHSVARGASGDERIRPVARIIAMLAYACAALAGVLQFAAAASGGALPSSAALTLLTSGLVVLAPALILSTRSQATDRRALWMTALAIFSVSAVHLSRFHGADESWTVELLGHHASIPLAFAILYQDYRFALADLFLKQALALIVLVALVFTAWSTLSPSLTTASPSSAAISALLASWVATALLFPWIRRGITEFVDRVVLVRADYPRLVEALASEVQHSDSPGEVLEHACAALRPALSATAVTWEPGNAAASPRVAQQELLIPTADTPQFVLRIGGLAGGRRFLSDDLAMLERVASIVARRIDVLRLTEERYQRALHEREMRTLATEAELRALQAQVNPHFLFNALTTIGYLIQSAPPRALDTLLRLTTLLRSVLRSEGEFTTLGRELELIDSYLKIEAERFEERLQVTLDVPAPLLDLSIPSLIVQPLVENAIKHGVAQARGGGLVAVTARLNTSSPHTELTITVRNTGAPLRGRYPPAGAGIGLPNVERRLHHHYGDDASLTLTSDSSGVTVAQLRLPTVGVEDSHVVVTSRDVEW